MEERLELPIGDKKLVVSIDDWKDDMPNEIVVSLEDSEGQFIQDICLVREHYRFDEKKRKFVRDDSLIDCKVWGDPWSEEYTDEFTIGVYEEEDE